MVRYHGLEPWAARVSDEYSIPTELIAHDCRVFRSHHYLYTALREVYNLLYPLWSEPAWWHYCSQP